MLDVSVCAQCLEVSPQNKIIKENEMVWGALLFTLLSNYLKVKVTQLSLTLCDPMDCIVHGILQARILKWVAVPSSSGSSQSRDQTQISQTASRFFTI